VPATSLLFKLQPSDRVVYHLPLTYGPQTTDTEV